MGMVASCKSGASAVCVPVSPESVSVDHSGMSQLVARVVVSMFDAPARGFVCPICFLVKTGIVRPRGAAAPGMPNRVSFEGTAGVGGICADHSPTCQTPLASKASVAIVAAMDTFGAGCSVLMFRSQKVSTLSSRATGMVLLAIVSASVPSSLPHTPAPPCPVPPITICGCAEVMSNVGVSSFWAPVRPDRVKTDPEGKSLFAVSVTVIWLEASQRGLCCAISFDGKIGTRTRRGSAWFASPRRYSSTVVRFSASAGEVSAAVTYPPPASSVARSATVPAMSTVTASWVSLVLRSQNEKRYVVFSRRPSAPTVRVRRPDACSQRPASLHPPAGFDVTGSALVEGVWVPVRLVKVTFDPGAMSTFVRSVTVSMLDASASGNDCATSRVGNVASNVFPGAAVSGTPSRVSFAGSIPAACTGAGNSPIW
mmetsp:Transcript_13744/g.33329  ORF Transcript_13744/g.33329 Transcript_13744/m.33329 type:complete len:426 (-) Transcript_13744:607-1884(-)